MLDLKTFNFRLISRWDEPIRIIEQPQLHFSHSGRFLFYVKSTNSVTANLKKQNTI